MVHCGELGVWSGKLLNNKKALLSSMEGTESILHCSHQTQAVPLLWSRGKFSEPLKPLIPVVSPAATTRT